MLPEDELVCQLHLYNSITKSCACCTVGMQIFPKWMDVWINELVIFPPGMSFFITINHLFHHFLLCWNFTHPFRTISNSQIVPLLLWTFIKEMSSILEDSWFSCLHTWVRLVFPTINGAFAAGIYFYHSYRLVGGKQNFLEHFLHGREYVRGFMFPHHSL